MPADERCEAQGCSRMAMATSRYCTVHHEDRLDGRIDELANEVRAGFELCATKVLADEIAYQLHAVVGRLDEAVARIQTLEMQVAHLEHPARPRKVSG
jgi:hypothetical protein